MYFNKKSTRPTVKSGTPDTSPSQYWNRVYNVEIDLYIKNVNKTGYTISYGS